MSRYRFIAAEKAQHSVVVLCRVLGVAKSAFYAWQRHTVSARARTDAQLTEDIKAVYEQSRCTYGAPRVHAALRRTGKRVARKRVARLMRQAGLVGRCPRRFRRTTEPDERTQVRDLVRRQFRPAAPDQVWVADISYIRTWEGWLYLAVILDAYSRKVVGWAFADHLRTVAWGPNRLDIFGLGTDHAMYHKWWNGSWGPSTTDWEGLGGVFTSPPAVATWGANRLDIFGLGTDHAMYHKWWNGSWGPSTTDWKVSAASSHSAKGVNS